MENPTAKAAGLIAEAAARNWDKVVDEASARKEKQEVLAAYKLAADWHNRT